MKKRRRRLSGFTLLELIIVMAIFSGIAVGAMAMIRPALKLYHKTSAQEKAVAAVDSVGRCIQDNLRYADNIMIYRNTGINNIDDFIDFPFNYHSFGIVFPLQKSTNIVVVEGGTLKESSGSPVNPTYKEDSYKVINPLSYFVAYHYEESKFFDGVTPKTDCDDYFRNKTVCIMEIKEGTGEIGIYEFPLIVGTDRLYDALENGVCVHYCDPARKGGNKKVQATDRSPGSEFLASETRKIKKADGTDEDVKLGITGIDVTLPGSSDFPGDPTKGINFKFEYSYMGATQVINQEHEVAVSFANANKKHYVNDIQPYEARSFEYYDCTKRLRPLESIKCVGSGSPLQIATQVSHDANGGSVFIIYSLPDIIK